MCMEYEAFTEKFKTCMEQELGEGNEVSFSSMEKINQVEWKGLQVRREREGTAAILPLRGMYAEYQKGGMGQAVKTAAQMLVRKPDISVEGLDTMMQEGLGQFQDFPQLYVLSNQQGCYGAAGILRRDLLKGFSERVQSSFYILPSSLHETILMVEKADVRGGELRELVMSINEAEVAREEWLSENVYYYDKEKAEVRIAE